MFDIYCIVSEFLNIFDLLSFRLVCLMFNKVFIEYRLRLPLTINYIDNENNDVESFNWLSLCGNLTIENCSFQHWLFPILPYDTILFECSISDPILGLSRKIRRIFIKSAEVYYQTSMSFRFCRCDEGECCMKHMCNNLSKIFISYNAIIHKDIYHFNDMDRVINLPIYPVKEDLLQYYARYILRKYDKLTISNMDRIYLLSEIILRYTEFQYEKLTSTVINKLHAWIVEHNHDPDRYIYSEESLIYLRDSLINLLEENGHDIISDIS